MSESLVTREREIDKSCSGKAKVWAEGSKASFPFGVWLHPTLKTHEKGVRRTAASFRVQRLTDGRAASAVRFDFSGGGAE